MTRPTGSFLNCYRCPSCGATWTDVDDASPDMDCDACGFRRVAPIDLAEAAPGTGGTGGYVIDEHEISEADEAGRSVRDAFAAYVEQMDRNETMPIIEMYGMAARKAGCNPEALHIALECHYRPA